MKRSILTGFLLSVIAHMQAQSQVQIPLKQRLQLEYTIFPMGQIFPCTFTIDTTAEGSMVIAWVNELGRGGRIIMTRTALDTGSIGYWGPPAYGEDIVLDDNQTVLLLSKKQWAELQRYGRVNYDGLFYTQKAASGENQVMIDDKPADAILLQSESSEARIWILNNPALPLLLKVENNPVGVDLKIERVKQ